MRAAIEKPFADKLLLWKKTKTDIVEEMSTALQMPGWGNSFTQPIANRIEMPPPIELPMRWTRP